MSAARAAFSCGAPRPVCSSLAALASSLRPQEFAKLSEEVVGACCPVLNSPAQSAVPSPVHVPGRTLLTPQLPCEAAVPAARDRRLPVLCPFSPRPVPGPVPAPAEHGPLASLLARLPGPSLLRHVAGSAHVSGSRAADRGCSKDAPVRVDLRRVHRPWGRPGHLGLVTAA